MNCLIRPLSFSLLLLAAVPACADLEAVTRNLHQSVEPAHFVICHGGGCATEVETGLDDEEWESVREEFNGVADNADAERQRIANAISLLERIIGLRTGTSGDRAGTFGNSAYPGQMDCNDEATNTTTYLKLMLREGLLRFHHPIDTKTRAFFFNGWPHTTAVMQENNSGKKFAVDSWFHDNGEPPEIVPLELWQSGWKPEGFD